MGSHLHCQFVALKTLLTATASIKKCTKMTTKSRWLVDYERMKWEHTVPTQKWQLNVGSSHVRISLLEMPKILWFVVWSFEDSHPRKGFQWIRNQLDSLKPENSEILWGSSRPRKSTHFHEEQICIPRSVVVFSMAFPWDFLFLFHAISFARMWYLVIHFERTVIVPYTVPTSGTRVIIREQVCSSISLDLNFFCHKNVQAPNPLEWCSRLWYGMECVVRCSVWNAAVWHVV